MKTKDEFDSLFSRFKIGEKVRTNSNYRFKPISGIIIHLEGELVKIERISKKGNKYPQILHESFLESAEGKELKE